MTTEWADQKKLEAATRVGKDIWLNARDTGMPTRWGVVEDEVGLIVDGAKHVIQRIRFADDIAWDGCEYGYKTGSFVVDPRSGSIKWAQYSQVLSEHEYRELLALAKARGWPIL
jgi:hypothetical protein